MKDFLNYSLTTRFVLVAGMLTLFGACGTNSDSNVYDQSYVNDSSSESTNQADQLSITNPFDPMIVGDNTCYLVQAYFPKVNLKDMLPDHLTIPDDATMATYYPDTKLKPDAHPFLMSFCHGANIHDVLTKINVPEQEEIMFLFPVIYKHDDGEQHLCSYVPVLYLDSFLGVLGGLYYDLRKEFHPKMKHGETENSKWWSIDDVFEASFVMQTDNDMGNYPNFIEQTYANPFVTISYPTPWVKTTFYQAKVYPNIVRPAEESFYWNYQGATVIDGEDTWSVYTDYHFTMSQPMKAKKYFEQ